MKSYRAEKAVEPYGMFQHHIRTDVDAWDNVRRPQNVRQALRTFTNVSKALKNPSDASEHPQNIIEWLKTYKSPSKLLRNHENISKQNRTPQKVR